jgi:uncharacterized protein (DUF58 family)
VTRSWLAAVGHFVVEADHLPRLNRYLPWRSAFGSLLMLAGAALLCGLFVQAQAFVLLAGVGAVLAVGSAWPWVSTRGLRGRVGFAAGRGREGEPVAVSLRVTNWLPVGAWGVRARAGLGAGGPALAVVPGWRRSEYTWEFVPGCRGEYPLAAPRLASGFPFGLWEASRPAAVDRPLLVWPAVFPVRSVPEAAASSRSREGVVPQNRAGTAGDIFAVRPYRRGDPRRRIHWPQTARFDRLIVCERQATASPRVQIVLDADPAGHRGGRPNGSREWAIRIAASIVEGLLAEGVSVGLVAGRQEFVPDAGGPCRQRLLDALARLPDDTPELLAEVLARPACRTFADGLQLVITTDLGFARLSPVAARRGHFVVLRAAAFAGEDAAPAPELPTRPLVWIDDPARVPEQFRHGWREVLSAN